MRVIINIPDKVLKDLFQREFRIQNIEIGNDTTINITVMYRHRIERKQRERGEEQEKGGEWIADKMTLEGVIDVWP